MNLQGSTGTRTWIYPGVTSCACFRAAVLSASTPNELEMATCPAAGQRAPAGQEEPGSFARSRSRSSSRAILDRSISDRRPGVDEEDVVRRRRRGCTSAATWRTSHPRSGQKYSIYEPGKYGAGLRRLRAHPRQSSRSSKRQAGQAARARTLEREQGDRARREGRPAGQGVQERLIRSRPRSTRRGEVVAIIVKDQLIGQGEIGTINLGNEDRNEVGNRMLSSHPPRRRTPGATATPTSARTTAGSPRKCTRRDRGFRGGGENILGRLP